MSLLSEKLRTHRIINVFDLLSRFGEKGKDICVTYSPRPSGRMGICGCNKSSVYSTSHKTDPHASWNDNGCKVFVGKRSESLPAAIQWATEKYGITEWVNNPCYGGGKVPAYVVQKAKQFLKQQAGQSAPK